jgi:hypothetical protein
MIAAPPVAAHAPGGGPSLDTRADLFKGADLFRNSTPPDPSEADLSSSATLRRSLWEGEQGRHRRRVICALRDPGIPGTAEQRSKRRKWAFKLEDCGTAWSTWATVAGEGKVTPHHCDQQVCPRCSFHRGRDKRARFDWITSQALAAEVAGEKGRRIRMITLTQRVKEGERWEAAKDRLLSGFRRWWKDKETRQHVRGWLRRIETTWSSSSNGWHVHIHLACEGSFWDQREIQASWDRHTWWRNTTALEEPRKLRRSTVISMLRSPLPDGTPHRIALPPGEDLDLECGCGDPSACSCRVTLPAGTVYTLPPILDVRAIYRPAELFKYLLKTAVAPASKIVEYVEQSVRCRLLEFGGSWRSVEMPEEEADDHGSFFRVCEATIRDIATGKIPEAHAPAALFKYPEIPQALPLSNSQLDQWKAGELKPHRLVEGAPMMNRPPSDLVAWSRRVNVAIERGIQKMIKREDKRIKRDADKGKGSLDWKLSRALPRVVDHNPATPPTLDPSRFRPSS